MATLLMAMACGRSGLAEHPCVALPRAVTSGVPVDTGSYSWAGLPHCDTLGADAAAAGLRRLRRVADERHIAARVPHIHGFRDPEVLAAALALAADTRATPAIRVHALALLLSIAQSKHATYEMMTATGPDGAPTCRNFMSSSYSITSRSGELPQGHAGRIRALAKSLTTTPGPSEVRTAARCVFQHIPPELDSTNIRARYVCDNRFEVENLTDGQIVLAYRRRGDDQIDLLWMEPSSKQGVILLDAGALEIVDLRARVHPASRSPVLQTAEHGDMACRRHQ